MMNTLSEGGPDQAGDDGMQQPLDLVGLKVRGRASLMVGCQFHALDDGNWHGQSQIAAILDARIGAGIDVEPEEFGVTSQGRDEGRKKKKKKKDQDLDDCPMIRRKDSKVEGEGRSNSAHETGPSHQRHVNDDHVVLEGLRFFRRVPRGTSVSIPSGRTPMSLLLK